MYCISLLSRLPFTTQSKSLKQSFKRSSMNHFSSCHWILMIKLMAFNQVFGQTNLFPF